MKHWTQLIQHHLGHVGFLFLPHREEYGTPYATHKLNPGRTCPMKMRILTFAAALLTSVSAGQRRLLDGR